MGEHTVPVGTHGTALYRELLHVPMIFYIPDNRPRVVGGAVTNLDIVPTVAELARHRRRRSARSRAGAWSPQLFYGKEDRERIVFAETNAPGKQRAAISERWKLIYYLNSNLYELFDLRPTDDWEKANLAPKDPPAMTLMKRALEAWMDRVLYARDPLFNQAFRRDIADLIVRDPPVPEGKVTGQRLAGGALEIIGIGRDPAKPLAPGAKVDLHVYFRVVDPVPAAYRFQLVAWPQAAGAPLDAPVPPAPVRSANRITADGAYPTDRWRKGEYIRERFSISLPATFQGETLAVGLVAADAETGQRARPTGAAPGNEPDLFSLGTLPVSRL